MRKFCFLSFVYDTKNQSRISTENQCQSTVLHSALIGRKYSLTSLWGEESLHLCVSGSWLSVTITALWRPWGIQLCLGEVTRKIPSFLQAVRKINFLNCYFTPWWHLPCVDLALVGQGACGAWQQWKVQPRRQQLVWFHPTHFCRKWG